MANIRIIDYDTIGTSSRSGMMIPCDKDGVGVKKFDLGNLALNDDVTNEALARDTAINNACGGLNTTLTAKITAEETARTEADTALQESIDGVLGTIHSLTNSATESDIASGNYFAIDGSNGTKKLPANLLAKNSDVQNLINKVLYSSTFSKEIHVANGFRVTDWTNGTIEITGNPSWGVNIGYCVKEGYKYALSSTNPSSAVFMVRKLLSDGSATEIIKAMNNEPYVAEEDCQVIFFVRTDPMYSAGTVTTIDEIGNTEIDYLPLSYGQFEGGNFKYEYDSIPSIVYFGFKNFTLGPHKIISLTDTQNFLFKIFDLDGNVVKPMNNSDYANSSDYPIIVTIHARKAVSGTAICGTDLSQCIIVKNEVQQSDGKKPYQEGQIHFSVTAHEFDGTEITRNAVLQLPSTYTADGTPCNLVMIAHGSSGMVSASQWYNDSTGDFESLVSWFNSNGFAVFDVDNADEIRDFNSSTVKELGCQQILDTFHNAYNYVVENYNVRKEMFVYGMSQGTFSAQNYTRIFGAGSVLAMIINGPRMNMASMWETYADSSKFGYDGNEFDSEKTKPWDTYVLVSGGGIIYGNQRATFFGFGGADSTGYDELTNTFISRLKQNGYYVESHSYDGLTHHQITQPTSEIVREDMLNFMKKFA